MEISNQNIANVMIRMQDICMHLDKEIDREELDKDNLRRMTTALMSSIITVRMFTEKVGE